MDNGIQKIGRLEDKRVSYLNDNSLSSYPLNIIPSKCKSFAFTLAEVLITLGIIGVVAALTIPSLIAKYQKLATVNQLKKTYSLLNQAFRMSESQNGEFSEWQTKDSIGATQFFNTYWKPYLNGVQVCKTYQECGYKELYPWHKPLANNPATGFAVVDNETDNRISFYIADGTFISLSNNVYVDLNGPKKPNLAGRDVFVFRVTQKGIQPFGYDSGSVEYSALARCSKNSTNSYNGEYCSLRIIMVDNWQIADDYPW